MIDSDVQFDVEGDVLGLDLDQTLPLIGDGKFPRMTRNTWLLVLSLAWLALVASASLCVVLNF